MRVAVTGATGRLGRAVIDAVTPRTAWQAVTWVRPVFDLDRPEEVARLVARDRPDVVVHCAAWTDVDGCARDPELAERRNGHATGSLARACANAGVSLVALSTNEVFDGRRTDRMPYRTSDEPSPANPYGRSKRLGEELALDAYAGHAAGTLWIVRTAWLFGPPGADFPTKIVAAARAAAAEGRTMRLVADEIGCPTSSSDLATALVDIVEHPPSGGILHVVNDGQVSRAEWARRVINLAGIQVNTEDVSMATWVRPSTPPRWGVLEATRLPTISRLRSWTLAVDEDAAARFRPAFEGLPA